MLILGGEDAEFNEEGVSFRGHRGGGRGRRDSLFPLRDAEHRGRGAHIEPRGRVRWPNIIAQALNGVVGNRFSATVTNEHPLTFFAAGVKYRITPGRAVEPYVMGGFGRASYDTTEVVRFFSGATDITSQLSQYGVVLGADLVGRGGPVTKLMLLVGGGVSVAVWRHVIIDMQYRFGDVLADNQAIYLNRVGIGVGARF